MGSNSSSNTNSNSNSNSSNNRDSNTFGASGTAILTLGGEGCHNSTAAAAADSDSFDCQSLQRCLKRVRLTSNISPGELRLQRDLRHAVLSHQWRPVHYNIDNNNNNCNNECEWTIPYQTQAQRRRLHQATPAQSTRTIACTNERCPEEDEDDCMFQTTAEELYDEPDYNSNNSLLYYDTLNSNNVSIKMTRNEQDPMELFLFIYFTAFHPVAWSAAVTSTIVSSVTLHLQFPRMYPHRPPIVRRIEYKHQQQQHRAASAGITAPIEVANPNRWNAGNLTHSHWSSNTSSGEANGMFADSSENGVKSNNSHCILDDGLLQRIVIAASPDCDSEILASTPGTVVLTEWSPVSRLTDICEWLVDAVIASQVDREQQQTRRSDNGLLLLHQDNAQTNNSHTNNSINAALWALPDNNKKPPSRSPSTPTTCNCSTVSLRYRGGTEEKKDTDDGVNNLWGGLGGGGSLDISSSSAHEIAFASSLIWDQIDQMDDDEHVVSDDAVDGWKSDSNRAANSRDGSNSSVSALHPGRFDVGYDRQPSGDSDWTMDCQYDV